jgi:Flp pilus assembly protein TadG
MRRRHARRPTRQIAPTGRALAPAAGRVERGQALVEAALALPLLVLVALAVLQLALLAHAQHVVTGAAQDGARVAAAADRTPADGAAHAEALLVAGLGRAADGATVQAWRDGAVAVVEVRGTVRLRIPWAADAAIPVAARAMVAQERFRASSE